MFVSVHCVGCGTTKTGCINNRVSKNKSSESVVLLWHFIYDELLKGRAGDVYTINSYGRGGDVQKMF